MGMGAVVDGDDQHHTAWVDSCRQFNNKIEFPHTQDEQYDFQNTSNDDPAPARAKGSQS